LNPKKPIIKDEYIDEIIKLINESNFNLISQDELNEMKNIKKPKLDYKKQEIFGKIKRYINNMEIK
jgi:hypothetical protein